MNPPNDDLDADPRVVLDDLLEHRSDDPVPAEATMPERVLAVLVCHNGDQFLPRALQAIAALETKPDWLVAVDVGSTDVSLTLLRGDGSPVNEILSVPGGTGFSLAVHTGVDAAGASDWVWVLHDDCAPEPTALRELLAAAAEQPSIGVLGPKVLGWDEPRRLLELGISISRSGRRHTGLESGEQDQGQHDGQRDVLAVGSPGQLVRREVWDRLGGFDKALRLFRDDVDFGWRANLAACRVVVVTNAVIHHAEAVTHGRRRIGDRRIHREDRASGLYVLLVNSTPWALLPRWLWLMLVSLIRAVGFLVGKSPQEAAGEIGAFGQVLLRPGPILRGRRSRKRRRVVSQRSLRDLFPAPGQQLRQTAETLVGALTVNEEVQPSSILETGPADEDIDSFVVTGSGRLRRLVRRPGTLLFLGLLTFSLIAWRGLYRDGVLHGGALLPVPRGTSDIWSTYLASWHPVSVGSPVVAHPSMAVFGGLAWLLLGKATWVVPVIMVVGPALAGLITFWLLKSFAVSTRLRLWAAAAYALNPALLSAVMQGRWGTVIVAVLLPLLGLAVARACGVRRPPSGRAAAVVALLLSVIFAVAPVLLVPLMVLVAVVGMRVATGKAARLQLLAALCAPGLLLASWVPQVIADPSLLLLESGVPLAVSDTPPWHVLLLNPGGLAALPLLLGGGIVLAGVASVVRARDVRAVRFALLAAGLGLGWALVVVSVQVTPSFSAVPVAPWPGSSLVLAAAGLVGAAAIAARASGRRLETRALSWRQPTLAVVTLIAVVTPLFAAVWWIDRGTAGPIDRGFASPLPAFVRAQSQLPSQIRTLVLKPGDGRLTYTLLRQRDAQFGDVEISPPAARMTDLDAVVADLASGRGSAPVDRLAQYAVQYILAVPPVDEGLEVALDSAPGLLRVANPGESSLWRIERPTGRLRVVDSDGSSTVLPSDPIDTETSVPAGVSDRILEMAELEDPGWRATTLDSDLPKRTVAGWSQGFDVTAAAGDVTIEHQNPFRTMLFWLQLVVLVIVLVIALPSRRRDQDTVV